MEKILPAKRGKKEREGKRTALFLFSGPTFRRLAAIKMGKKPNVSNLNHSLFLFSFCCIGNNGRRDALPFHYNFNEL